MGNPDITLPELENAHTHTHALFVVVELTPLELLKRVKIPF